ncbi:MAG: alpha/beta hydrolase [Gemmatimonadota bacterium]|nr:alpha/beta hydrolase [Gemmatimonadota bacterium]
MSPSAPRWAVFAGLLAVAGCEARAEPIPAEASAPSAAASAVDHESGSGSAEAGSAVRPDSGSTGSPPEAATLQETANAARAPGPPEVDPPTFDRPEHIRGIYLNAWAAGSARRSEQLIELARRTEVNAFVIDIKDASGYVSHRTDVPLAKEVGATGEIRIRDLPGLLRRLADEGIYPIARIVIVKDPILAAARPDLAVQDTAGGVWVDGKGIVWLNPYNRDVWDYHVALAREVAALGFPEIQWDYVRFPDAPRADLARAVFAGPAGSTRAEGIRELLRHTREELAASGVRVTADVFGMTTSATGDVGIGQVWERFIGVVDAALPMIYPSHYAPGAFGIDRPNAYPYEVVKQALSDALRRSADVVGAGETVPWLQDFTLGPPRYGAPEVRAQIQATYDAGIQSWVLWNPGSRYTEAALMPSDGFAEEPSVRVAGRVVPVSRRLVAAQSDVAPESHTFESDDGLSVSAHLYAAPGAGTMAGENTRPVVVAFHQGGGDARGEYGPIVPRLVSEGFDVLAVDLRLGGDRFGGENPTAAAWAAHPASGEASGYCVAERDVRAAVDFAAGLRPEAPLILWGSSYSAALALRVAAEAPPGVVGVLSFSPATGEPMEGCAGEDASAAIPFPALVLRPAGEAAMETVNRQSELFRRQGHSVFVADPGAHGSSMLVEDRVGANVEATWREVLAFLHRVVSQG